MANLDDKTKFLCKTPPLMQHHSSFTNEPPLFMTFFVYYYKRTHNTSEKIASLRWSKDQLHQTYGQSTVGLQSKGAFHLNVAGGELSTADWDSSVLPIQVSLANSWPGLNR